MEGGPRAGHVLFTHQVSQIPLVQLFASHMAVRGISISSTVRRIHV